MAALPSSIQVGPFAFEVIVSTDGHCLTSRDRGTTNLVNMTITLDATYAEQHRRKILLHEVLHAVSFAVGPGEENEPMGEEQWIAKLSSTLLDTLRRNPDLVAYLMTEQT